MISLKPFSTPQELGKDQASLINFLAMESTTLLAAESKEKINIRIILVINKKSASRQIARSFRTALAHASALIFLRLGQALISGELAFDNRANDDNARALHEDREQNPVANLGRLGDRGTLEFWAVRSRDREENEAEEQSGPPM